MQGVTKIGNENIACDQNDKQYDSYSETHGVWLNRLFKLKQNAHLLASSFLC